MAKKERCESCVFRAEKNCAFQCNYLALTGHTRLAEPPEECSRYIQGDRLETQEQTARFLQELAVKQQKKPDKRRKYDWGRAEELYRAGANDGEIAKELGACATAVYQWRKRMKLPANTQAGGLHGKRAEQTRTNEAEEPVKMEESNMKKETKDHILQMLHDEVETKRWNLDRILVQGGDGKRELEEYRTALLAKEDFEKEAQK